MSDVSESLRLLTKNEWCERISQVTHQKWAAMSKSLMLLTKNERPCRIAQGTHQKWATEQIARFFEQFANFFAKNKQFAQKTNERIPSPDGG